MKGKCNKLLTKLMQMGGSIDLVQPTEIWYNLLKMLTEGRLKR